jgi:hypothetical protein
MKHPLTVSSGGKTPPPATDSSSAKRMPPWFSWLLAINAIAGLLAASYVAAQNVVNTAELTRLSADEQANRPWSSHPVLGSARLHVPESEGVLLVVGSKPPEIRQVQDVLYPRRVEWLTVGMVPSDEELSRKAAIRSVRWVAVDGQSGIGTSQAEDRVWKLSE